MCLEDFHIILIELISKKNNTKFNNEYLKHRISCVPIHVNDDRDFQNIKNNYEVRVSVVNTENQSIYVTTRDFKLFNKETDKEIKENSSD